VVVTLGRQGALLHTGSGRPHRIPAPVIRTSDPCGAGDRFVATLAVALAAGSPLADAVHDAVNTAATFLAEGGVATLQAQPVHDEGTGTAAGPVAGPVAGTGIAGDGSGHAGWPDPGAGALEVIERVRAAGGTVVATGGCFDLLHAGHARTLQAARALGDCLVVLLNSDESVRRLKGIDRPIISARDRTELLAALGCVDGVLLFEEDTPHRALEQVRPDIWVKGGDYDAEKLPESGLIASWGGRTITVPFHVARSTTSLAAALAKVG
jgi:rfaE bifunctional protein nucleotidyltransferase chain/domain